MLEDMRENAGTVAVTHDEHVRRRRARREVDDIRHLAGVLVGHDDPHCLSSNGILRLIGEARAAHMPIAIASTTTPENIDVLLHGHTHLPRNERREGVLFLNPGCVTRPNRGALASVANLEIAADGKLRWRMIALR